MQAAPEIVTKAGFADLMQVSKAAVSQWIKKGILTADSLVGEGRTAKVHVARAREDVRKNRDIGQAFGNGIATKTGDDAVAPEPPIADAGGLDFSQPVADAEPAQREAVEPVGNSIEARLKQEKLATAQMQNRRLAEEEALRRGDLMSAEDVRGQMGRIANTMMQIFDGALPELAAAMSAQFQIPQRDVLHLLKGEMKKIRAAASEKEARRAAGLAEEGGVTVEIEG